MFCHSNSQRNVWSGRAESNRALRLFRAALNLLSYVRSFFERDRALPIDNLQRFVRRIENECLFDHDRQWWGRRESNSLDVLIPNQAANLWPTPPKIFGNADRNRTGEHLSESQGRLSSNLNGVTTTTGSDEGTRTPGHSDENRGRRAHNLNVATSNWSAERESNPLHGCV